MIKKKEFKVLVLLKDVCFVMVENDIMIFNYMDVLFFFDDILLECGGGKGLKFYDEIECDIYVYLVL